MDVFIITHQLILGSIVFREFKENLTRYAIKTQTFEDVKPTEKTFQVLDLYGDHWKWYEDNEDVNAWTKFVADAADMELNYEFIRIGEGDGDSQDIEVERSPEAINMLGVSRPTIWDDIPEKTELEL